MPNPSPRTSATTPPAAAGTPTDRWDFSALSGLTVNETPASTSSASASTVRPNAASLAQALGALEPSGTSTTERPAPEVETTVVASSPAMVKKPPKPRKAAAGTVDAVAPAPEALVSGPPVKAATSQPRVQRKKAQPIEVPVASRAAPPSVATPTVVKPPVPAASRDGSQPMVSFLIRPSADVIAVAPLVTPKPVEPVDVGPVVPAALLEQRPAEARAQRGQVSVATWTDGAWSSATPDEKRRARRVFHVLVAMIALVCVALWWASTPGSSVKAPVPVSRPAASPAMARSGMPPVAAHPVVPSAARAAPAPKARPVLHPVAPVEANPVVRAPASTVSSPPVPSAATAPSGAVAVTAPKAHRATPVIPAHRITPARPLVTPATPLGKPFHLDSPAQTGLTVT